MGATPQPTTQQKPKQLNLMSLKPREVEQLYKSGQLKDTDVDKYILKKELERKKFHDLDPADVEKGYKLGLFSGKQVDDYIDRKENPVTYHIKDMFGGIAQGVTSAVDETVQTAEWLAKNVTVQSLAAKAFVETAQPEEKKKLYKKAVDTVHKPVIGEVYKPKTVAGEVSKGVTQFLAGFVGASKVMGPVKTVRGALAKGTAAGAVTDFSVFDEHDARLSNLIQEHPSLRNPVTDYLKAEKDDTLFEGKLKNAIEGLGLGVATEALFMGVKQVKNLKFAKHNEDVGDVATEINQKFPPKKKRGKKAKSLAEEQPKPTPEATPEVKPEATPSGVVDNIAEEAKQPKPAEPTGGELYDEATKLKLSTNLTQGDAQDLANDILALFSKDAKSPENPGVINIDKYKSTDQVRDALILASKSIPDVGVEHHSVVKELAAMARTDEKALWSQMNELAGSMEGATKLLVAARDSMAAYSDALAKRAQELRTRMDDPKNPITTIERLEFVDQVKMLNSMMNMVKGVTTNSARMVSSGRIEVNGHAFDLGDMTGEDIKTLIGRGVDSNIDDFIKVFSEAKDPVARAKVASQMSGKGLSGVVEYYQASLLSSPATHLTNTVSSASNILLDEIAGAATRAPRETKYRLKGLYHGMIDGFTMAVKAFKEEAPQLDKVHRLVNENGEVFENFSIKGKKGEVIRALSFRPMLFIDELFKNIAYRAELTSMAYENAVKLGLKTDAEISAHVARVVASPNKQAHLQALDYARRMTFQEEFQPKGVDLEGLSKSEQVRMSVGASLDKFFQGGQNLLNSSWAGHAVKILVMPFYHTVVNLAKAAGRMSPGFHLLSKRYLEDIAAGGSRANRARAKLAIGASIYAYGFHLYETGQFVGGIDKDMQKIAAENGILSYSVFDEENGKMTSSQLIKYDPFITILGLAADFAKACEEYEADDDAELSDFGPALVMSIANITVNKSFMQSAQAFVQAISEGEGWMERYLQQKASGFIPYSGALSFTQEQLDDYQRNITDLREMLYSKVHAGGLTKKYNVLGEPKMRHDRNFIAGMQAQVSDDPVLNEMLMVKLNMGAPNRKIEFRGVEVELTSEQYARYNELIRQPKPYVPEMRESLLRAINTTSYQNLDSMDMKADKLRNIISRYREAAKRQLIMETPELMEKMGSRNAVVSQLERQSNIDDKTMMSNHWVNELAGNTTQE